ncbi:GGDEF domain-containing protein [Halomonas getboli]|uniref:GGDEF domain-containing protein n=1 Tax=Halomonas getboli TaxID=2935862 RepID=UPI001FFE872B|nr:GGDEF domain-containing protein [Halomonas getboli]MCK2184073.1 GGDEF domain-containing protein [Halomonas getboli]
MTARSLCGLRAAFASRLARRQVRLVLVVALALGWLLSGVQIAIDYRNDRQSQQESLDQLVTSTLSTAASAAWQLDGHLARVMCEGLIAHPAIHGCRLRLPGDIVLGDSRKPQVAAWLPFSAGLFGGERRLELPLRHQGQQPVGALVLEISPANAINDFATRMLVTLLAGTLRALALALVLFAAFHALTIRPITRLSRFLVEAGERDFATDRPPRPHHRHDDEIRTLEATTLKLMHRLGSRVEELHAAKLALEETNRHQEARIRERTLELERTVQAMKRQAYSDPLTGLDNRRAFFEAAPRYLEHWQRYGEGFAVILADLDDFKAINDRLGHDQGDRALCAVAALLLRTRRQGDVIARFGGEEFIGLFKVSTRDAALEAADRLRREVAALAVEGLTRPLTVSIGVALVRPDDTAIDGLVTRADRALYRAKHDGRDRVRDDDRPQIPSPGE